MILNVPGMFISLIGRHISTPFLYNKHCIIVHHDDIPALDHHVQLVITQRPECGTKKTYLFIYLFILSHEFVC